MLRIYRLSTVIAISLAATLPFLSSRLARPTPPSSAATERAGLTLGAGLGRHVIITSLRAGGPADRAGLAVGDRLLEISGHRVLSLGMSRRLLEAPSGCDILVDIYRAGFWRMVKIQQCSK